MMINMKDKEEVKDIIVSDTFMEVYKNFNVYDQVETMKQLEPRELYLLLTLCLDKHDDDNVIVKHNLLPFRSEVLDIYDILDDKDPGNKILSDLIIETDDKYIETENIKDSKGNSVMDPFTLEEVRDKKIDIINDISN
jgi:hypothetical protein